MSKKLLTNAINQHIIVIYQQGKIKSEVRK